MMYAQDRCLRVKSSQTSFVLSIFVHIIVSGKHHKHMLGKYSILNCVFLNLHCLYLMSGLFWRCSHLPTMVCHMWPKFLLAFFPVPDDILNPKKKVFETVQVPWSCYISVVLGFNQLLSLFRLICWPLRSVCPPTRGFPWGQLQESWRPQLWLQPL